MSHNIDRIFYINLDHRKDRREEFENEVKLMNWEDKAERFEAIKNNIGIVGAGYSHTNVLKLAKQRGYKNVLICEDDFTLLVDKETLEKELTNFFDNHKDFDVCMLAYNLIRHEEIPGSCVNKVIEAQTSTAYIVNAKFYDPLIQLFEHSIPMLERTHHHWIYANDQCWKPLQPISNWYSFKIRIGRQRPSFSDNTLRFEDLGV